MSKIMGIYVKFTKTTHQIWSCHGTLASNSKNFYISPNSILNFRKGYRVWGKLAQEQKSYWKKTNWGWKTPPVLIGSNNYPWTRLSVRIIGTIKRHVFHMVTDVFDISSLSQEVCAIDAWKAIRYSLGHGSMHMLTTLPTVSPIKVLSQL